MKIQLDTEGYQPPRSGLVLLQCLVVVFFCIFVLRFWYLQIHRGDEFAQQAQDNRLRQESLYAGRGLIRDASGALLAENRTAFGLALIREDCRDIPATLAQVSSWTGIPQEQLRAKFLQDGRKARRIAKPFEPVLLIADMPFDMVARIEPQLLLWPGLEIVTRSKRTYPYKDVFAHILGYVAEANEKELESDKYLALGDNVGKQGLEYVLEERLRGRKGRYSVEVDVLGRSLGRTLDEEPQNGESVRLTLDAGLQQKIVDILGEQTGSAVVMEPRTGRIRALVTTPAYDTNLFVGGLSHKDWTDLRDNPRYPLQNRGIQSVYPPGSIWKLMMVGLFMQEGIPPHYRVTCTGEVKLGPQTFRCWRRGGHGSVDMLRSLTESCDVYYYVLGERIGIDKIYEYAKKCGFGTLSGIDLPHEKAGLVPSRAWKKRRNGESWYRGETLNVSIGQGYTLVTPLQMAVFVSALINDGKLMKPQILEGYPPDERGKIPMTAPQRAFVLDAMRQTADQGTARVLKRTDAVVGGKTGTAQVVKIRMSGERRLRTDEMAYFERDHAWIASWGLVNGEYTVVVVMIEHGGGGGSTAGPVARKIFDAMYLPPAPPEEGALAAGATGEATASATTSTSGAATASTRGAAATSSSGAATTASAGTRPMAGATRAGAQSGAD